MIAYVTSIGESTTDLCVWSLERLGFEVVLIKDNSSLAEKLKVIYETANDSFIRVDADVVVNKNALVSQDLQDKDWIQFQTFDWFKQDITSGGVQHINKRILPILRDNIVKHLNAERPESQMFRLKEFHNPRRCFTVPIVAGLHGYGQTDNDRVKSTKERRNQLGNYDFELAERIELF